MGRSARRKPPARGRNLGLFVLFAAAFSLDLFACASMGRARVEPVAATATKAFAEARTEARRRADGWEERALAAVDRALEAEPGWVAPRRFQDDLLRAELRAAEALAARLDELEESPQDAGLLYLVGRLEGTPGVARFQQAARIDPKLSWAVHGQAWMRFQQGDSRGALRLGRRALSLARDSWERSSFVTALARYLHSLGRAEDAAARIAEELERSDLEAIDRLELELFLARSELVLEDPAQRSRGFWRGIELLQREDLTDDEVRQLAVTMLAVAETLRYPGLVEELETALAQREGAARAEVRGRLLFERGSRELALAVLSRVEEEGGEGVRLRRMAELAAGDPRRAIEEWLAALPGQGLDDDGLPKRPELRRLVEAARDGSDDGALVGAMLDAGWFREVRARASSLASVDPELALALDEEAAAGRSVLAGIRRLLELVDSGSDYTGPWGGAAVDSSGAPVGEELPPDGGRIETLEELLAAMQPLFERHVEAVERTRDLASTPRLSYGSLAVVLHPGPRFSAADEEAGRGEEGATVGGLAEELRSIGRFGLFGQSVGGGGPDGTVLRLLATEERSGEHLGVPYTGTVAWCEGVDVPSRPVRRGARITGAALHEGYWVDIDGVRSELDHWRRLEREFLTADAARARRALEGRGPRVSMSDARVRAALYAPLGAGDRVRLAVLMERPASEEGRMSLEELVEATALHEEGHLTDRTRFLPLSSHVFGALRLLVEGGFSPRGVARTLEYRAQLVAMSVSQEPRIHLAECLDGAEGGNGVTPHAQAYEELAADLLTLLERERDSYPALDPDHYLVHQLHLLSADDVRRLALALAEDKGMVE